MARWNELLVGRYNRFAQKLFSMKGTSSLNQLDNVLQCVLPLFYGSENRYLEGWDLFGISKNAASPGVGNALTVAVRNPVGSNMMAVVNRIGANEATAAPPMLITLFRPGSAGAGAGDENTVLAPQGWDGRGRSSSTLVISHNTAAQVVRAGGVLIAGIQDLPANAQVELLRPGDEIPLTPGTLITITAGNNNEGMNFTVWWRERSLEDSELK